MQTLLVNQIKHLLVTVVYLTVIAESFEESCGIPNIVGALDGTHIPIVNCPGGNADYMNRKRLRINSVTTYSR